MQDAAQRLVGLHDFATFCRPRDFGTTIRDLQEVRVVRTETGVIEIWLRADAFCHNMVRAIVGALMAVGGGTASADEVETVLAAKSREDIYKVVAPRGLTLMKIGYPTDDKLAAQAVITKVQRQTKEDE
jgi:tRNA pseudouridine38-40 synthase